MLRGVDSSSALSPSQLTQVINTEGIRMSRKCSRLRPFLRAYGNFLIDFVTSLNNREYSNMISKRFRMAITKAAADHYNQWRLTGDQLWSRLIEKVRKILIINDVDPTRTELVSRVIGKQMVTQPSHQTTADASCPDSQQISPDPTLTIDPREEKIDNNENEPAKKRRRIDHSRPEAVCTNQNYVTINKQDQLKFPQMTTIPHS